MASPVRFSVVNRTPYPTGEVSRLLAWAMGPHWPELVRVRLRAAGSLALGGTSTTGRVVHIGLGREYPQEHCYPGLVLAPTLVLADWQEELVATAAHEARHVAAEGGGSEWLAEWAAVRRLRAWRRAVKR
jgi:hypothetical protein